MAGFVKNVLCLTLITLFAGAGLGYVYEITKEPIAQMEENTKLEAFHSVFPEADSFSDLGDVSSAANAIDALGISGVDIDSAVTANDASGNTIGYVINSTSHEGYGGDITLSVGIASDGTVKGFEILDISETAGLGMKAKEQKFRDQFANRQVKQFSYTKSGATQEFEIDALSGATITTKAVTNAVNASLAYFETLVGGAK